VAALSREPQPLTLVIGSVLALLYAVGSLLICLWVITQVFEDEGSRLSSGEQSGLVLACTGAAVTAFGIFCILRGLQRQVWAIALVVTGLAVGVFLGVGVTVMAFNADEDGLLSSGWFWLAVTLVMIVPVVLLSIAITKLPSPHETATDSH
jgi:ABC-type Fe3+-siderophore transport system permease subunit